MTRKGADVRIVAGFFREVKVSSSSLLLSTSLVAQSNGNFRDEGHGKPLTRYWLPCCYGVGLVRLGKTRL